MKASHLKLAYGTNNIYDDCSFHIEPGDKVGVIGVNGAGKSTLFRVILGQQSLDDGEISSKVFVLVFYHKKSLSNRATAISPSGIISLLADPLTTFKKDSMPNTKNSPNILTALLF